MNERFQYAVMFGGVLATPRTMAEVDFQLPPQVTSREQCVAMIAYYLDRCANGKIFESTRKVDWLAEGRRYKHLLPWEIERAKRELEEAPYRARPQCLVQRDWARLAIKMLARFLDADNPDAVKDETPIVFFFQDSVLTIRFDTEVIALAGKGTDWPSRYSIRAGQLRRLPRRFMGWQVEVSVWDGKLRIGDHLYAEIEDSPP